MLKVKGHSLKFLRLLGGTIEINVGNLFNGILLISLSLTSKLTCLTFIEANSNFVITHQLNN